jgi:hypothetical protein
MKDDIKAILLKNKLWKPFCSARAGLQRDTELKLDPVRLKESIAALLESHLRMCDGNEDLDEVDNEISGKNSHKKKAFAIKDLLTNEEIVALEAKEDPSLNTIAKWLSANFLRVHSQIDFTTAPSINTVMMYCSYRDDLPLFTKEILNKCSKVDKDEGVEKYDGENLAGFCVELRAMYSRSVLLAAEHERDLEDKRQAVLHGKG